MKKLIVILLGLLLFFNSSLFIIIYGLRIAAITKDVNEKMLVLNPDNMVSQTVLFKVPLSDPSLSGTLQRLNETEFMMDGFLYDIALQRIVKDTIYIFCLQDNEEGALLTNVLSHYENEGNKNPEMQYFNVLLGFLSNALVPQINIFSPNRTSVEYIRTPESATCVAFHEIPAPPPKKLV